MILWCEKVIHIWHILGNAGRNFQKHGHAGLKLILQKALMVAIHRDHHIMRLQDLIVQRAATMARHIQTQGS